MSALEPRAALRQLWQSASDADAALQRVALPGAEPVLPSSFAVGTAAQAALAGGALAAAEFGRHRNGLEQRLTVDMRHAALEACTHFLIDGQAPQLWDKLLGPVPLRRRRRCRRLGAHPCQLRAPPRRRAAPAGPADPATAEAGRCAAGVAALERARLRGAAADAGLVVTALRHFDEWDAHPQGRAVAAQPLFHIDAHRRCAAAHAATAAVDGAAAATACACST